MVSKSLGTTNPEFQGLWGVRRETQNRLRNRPWQPWQEVSASSLYPTGTIPITSSNKLLLCTRYLLNEKVSHATHFLSFIIFSLGRIHRNHFKNILIGKRGKFVVCTWLGRLRQKSHLSPGVQEQSSQHKNILTLQKEGREEREGQSQREWGGESILNKAFYFA